MNRIVPSDRVAARNARCEACPLRCMPAFRKLSHAEIDFVRAFKVAEITAGAGTTPLAEGSETDYLYTVLSGWGFRYKSLPDGRRQILNFVMPGDLLGLQSSLTSEMHHSVEALTKMTLCVFPRDRLWALFRDHPGLALDVTWLAARQERMLDENLLAIGQGSAHERIAYLLLHLYRRAEGAGLAGEGEMELPFTQQHVADALGLSLVHTNKTLRRLASENIARWSSGRLRINGLERLVAIAKNDPVPVAPRPLL